MLGVRPLTERLPNMFGGFAERFFGVRHSLRGVRLLFGRVPNT
jgi:hypothetical protein